MISLMCAAALSELAAAAGEIEVDLRSVGYETTCAEMDNVLVELAHPDVVTFDVVATHPAYLAPGLADDIAPDFSTCVFPDEPIWRVDDTYDITLFEDERILLRGWRLPARWREEEPPVLIGDRVFEGIHLTQLFFKGQDGPYEAVVLYPPDGYWRLRPLPPADRTLTGYGASVLIGPVETDRRPLVRLTSLRFDPETLTWWTGFARGGSAAVRVVRMDRDEARLEATLDRPAGAPVFALLSSMHVAPDNADIARVALRRAGATDAPVTPIERLSTARAAEARFGRDIPSRHNTSAPDFAFVGFRLAAR